MDCEIKQVKKLILNYIDIVNIIHNNSEKSTPCIENTGGHYI